jgi:hypothetical protein
LSINVYDKGELVRLAVVFRNLAGTVTDPTAVSFKMSDPDGTVTTYVYVTDAQLVKDSTGNYHVDWPTAKEGKHHYAWLGTGAVASAEEGQFTVKDTRF